MTGAHVDDRTAVLEARNVSLDFDGTDSSGSKVTIHALDRVKPDHSPRRDHCPRR